MTRALMPTIICKAKHMRQRLDALHAVADARQDMFCDEPHYTPGLSKMAIITGGDHVTAPPASSPMAGGSPSEDPPAAFNNGSR